jgi:hypothetical protein
MGGSSAPSTNASHAQPYSADGFDFSYSAPKSATPASKPAITTASKPAAAAAAAATTSHYDAFDPFASSSSGSSASQRQSSSAAASSSSSGGSSVDDPDMTLPGELDNMPSQSQAQAMASALDDLDDEPPVRRSAPPAMTAAPKKPVAAPVHDADDFTAHLTVNASLEHGARSAAASTFNDYEEVSHSVCNPALFRHASIVACVYVLTSE